MVPFLKWPGGKRWFVEQFSELIPRRFNRYFEPFLGGGSVFFHLEPHSALLADFNPSLVATYLGIRADWQVLTAHLAEHHENHSNAYYYRVRNLAPTDLITQASRMIYLNRTCFNGIFRTNKKGEFNVPRGDRNEILRKGDDFQGIARLLHRAEVRVSDFEAIVDSTRKDDLVFADPPYTVRHNINGFVRYNETLFSWQDQERLARALERARRRGVKIMCTNANHHSIRSLYRPNFCLRSIARFSGISATIDSRKQFTELLITANI